MLALEVGLSSKHLSFLETGRSQPSRPMLLRLAEYLEIPLRERNALLLSAGFAPAFPERALDDAQLDSARQAVRLVLSGHIPYPALAIDRHWTMVDANEAVAPLLADIAEISLLTPPINVLRLSFHPGGLAPRIANYATWRAHLLDRLRRQVEDSADPLLEDLLRELQAYPAPDTARREMRRPVASVTDVGRFAVPLQLHSEAGILSFISTTTVFGSPLEVTLSELAIEAFFPADETTGQVLRHLWESRKSAQG